jgi:hypothetical protein
VPSPFPGMDPFLEDPEIFPDLHDSFIASVKVSLNARLPEPYYAKIGRRVWIEVSQRLIGPDVNVLSSNGGPPRKQEAKSGVAVAAGLRSRPVMVRVPHDEIRQTFLEIYTRQGRKRLVTSVEVLSPSNKTPGDKARKLYRKKQRELLDSDVNLVEIDLLRAGTHTTAVPLSHAREKVGTFDYHVCVHDFGDLEEFAVFPIQLEEPLPEIGVPLLPGDGPVALDLQVIFDHCYDDGAYLREIRYAEDVPVPPLRPEQAQWAIELLRAKGLVPPAAAS